MRLWLQVNDAPHYPPQNATVSFCELGLGKFVVEYLYLDDFDCSVLLDKCVLERHSLFQEHLVTDLHAQISQSSTAATQLPESKHDWSRTSAFSPSSIAVCSCTTFFESIAATMLSQTFSSFSHTSSSLLPQPQMTSPRIRGTVQSPRGQNLLGCTTDRPSPTAAAKTYLLCPAIII